jgi:hypothetical protein
MVVGKTSNLKPEKDLMSGLKTEETYSTIKTLKPSREVNEHILLTQQTRTPITGSFQWQQAAPLKYRGQGVTHPPHCSTEPRRKGTQRAL